MKKILYAISLFLLAIVLIACDKTNKNRVPSVSEKDKVELTVEEFSELLSEIEFEGLTTKLSFDLKTTGKVDGENINLDISATVYGNIDGEVNGSVKAKVNLPSFTVDGKASIYVVPEDKATYVDVDALVNMSIFGDINSETTLKQKYKIPLDLDDVGEFDELLPIPIDFDLEKILAELQNLENIEKMMNYSGLTFYKKGDEYRIKLEITKALILENKDLFNGFTENFDLDEVEEFEFVVVIVVKANQLKEMGAHLKLKGGEVEDFVDLEMNMHLNFGAKIPKFPNFDEYEDFDPSSIFWGMSPGF